MASLVRPSAVCMSIARHSCFAAAQGSRMGGIAFAQRSPMMGVVSAQGAFQRYGFQTTSQRALLPPLPQKIPGTVNDAAALPPMSPSHGSHHWTFERTIAAIMPIVAAAPLSGASVSPLVDSVLCSVLLLHVHSGFQSIIIDYVPENRVPRAAWVFKWGLRAATLTVAAGLYEFETNDIGLSGAIKKIWHA
ncbi:membrane anchor subunit of succinate dehydrogenase, Sdh4 [Ascosphaera acerosa]|nr:membrane anchor subunit of succinate dehydrogenase, Sdh4 [Ascosphaera acerosa]